MPSVTYRILAVKERAQLVADLLSQLKMGEDIVRLDADKNGAIWNSYRVWNEQYETTHLCILNDDAEVVDDFPEIVEQCVARFPNAIWTFFTNQFDKDIRDPETPYIEFLSKNVRGICVVIPTKHLKGLCGFYDKFLRQYAYKQDDRTIGMYAFFNDIPVMATVPNLVCGKDVKSTFATYHKTLNSNCWYGRTIDKKQFETDVVKRLICWCKSAADSSLKPGCDIKKVLLNAYSQRMKKYSGMGVQSIRGGGNYRLAKIQHLQGGNNADSKTEIG